MLNHERQTHPRREDVPRGRVGTGKLPLVCTDNRAAGQNDHQSWTGLDWYHAARSWSSN